jgi:mannose-6-phosphate isomerase-like protein (cupin superfamily)
MGDFVVRRWELAHYPGDQAPPHVHLASDEAFCVVRGRLEVLVGDERRIIGPGEHVTVPAGTAHTFATVDPDGADVFCVMTPEVDRLVAALHEVSTDEERAGVWAKHRSELVHDPA